jgi:hypothetical protein
MFNDLAIPGILAQMISFQLFSLTLLKINEEFDGENSETTGYIDVDVGFCFDSILQPFFM